MLDATQLPPEVTRGNLFKNQQIAVITIANLHTISFGYISKTCICDNVRRLSDMFSWMTLKRG